MRKCFYCFLLLLLVTPTNYLFAQDGFASNSHEMLDMLLKTDDGGASNSGGVLAGHVYLKIEFDVNSAKIKKGAVALVRELALAMKSPRGQDMVILLRGHTDSDGSKGANQRLSLHRAEAVKSYLVKNEGISATRIKVEGCGEDEPLVPNNSAAAKARNRRVEVVNITVTPRSSVLDSIRDEAPAVEKFEF